MTDENQNNNQQNNQSNNINPEFAMKKVREMSQDSEWTEPQEILQEIIATYKVEQKKVPALDKLIEYLRQEIRERYKENPQKRDLFLTSIPSKTAVWKWTKKKGWEDAVWTKIRLEGLFTPERRAQVITKLYEKATQKGDVNAAKLWLTMSGDYSEKVDVNQNEVVEKFRDINNVLRKKHSNE